MRPNAKGLMLETSAPLYCFTFDQQKATVSLETRPFLLIIIILVYHVSLTCDNKRICYHKLMEQSQDIEVITRHLRTNSSNL